MSSNTTVAKAAIPWCKHWDESCAQCRREPGRPHNQGSNSLQTHCDYWDIAARRHPHHTRPALHPSQCTTYTPSITDHTQHYTLLNTSHTANTTPLSMYTHTNTHTLPNVQPTKCTTHMFGILWNNALDHNTLAASQQRFSRKMDWLSMWRAYVHITAITCLTTDCNCNRKFLTTMRNKLTTCPFNTLQ